MADGDRRYLPCFVCGRRLPRVRMSERAERVPSRHQVCDDCHAVNGKCRRCGYQRARGKP